MLGITTCDINFASHGEKQLSFKKSFIRTLCDIFSISLILPLAFPLLNKKQKSLSDIVSSTETITEEQMHIREENFLESHDFLETDSDDIDSEQLELDFDDNEQEQEFKQAA